MKFVFSLSEWSIERRPETWLEHLAICLNSLIANTDLSPALIWRGSPEHCVPGVVKHCGGEVVAADECFADIMLAPDYPSKRSPEVSLGTLAKLQAAYLFPAELQLVVGDVDVLWLRHPDSVDLGPGIAAGPQMRHGDRGLNAGMTVIDPTAMRERRLLAEAKKAVAAGIDSDEWILNSFFADTHAPLPWEHRAFWPLPAKTPAVVHFHGPKLDQIRNLAITRPADQGAITALYDEGGSELHTWAKIAEAYRNAPAPLLDLLTQSEP